MIKRKITLICILSVLCLTMSYGNEAPADGIIKGKIVAENGNQELPYVAVLAGGSELTYTNKNGFFEIKSLEYGNYQVVISYIGFEKKIIENVVISESSKVTDLGIIFLKESSIQIPEISIVAVQTNYNEKYKTSNAVISSEQLKQSNPIGTEEALKTLPGVNVSGDMGISNRLNIGVRGSYPRRSGKLLLLEDGTPIAPAPYLAPEAYYNPPSDRLDGIEVIKGADILTYGPNTMYGVINYITKRPSQKPTLGVNLTGGENGYRSLFTTYGGTWNNVGAELQVLNKHFDGFLQNSQTGIFNSTAKVFADFGKRSSAYFKVNYHEENSKATYSGLTPLTFQLDPKQNPFDADDLATKRYAVDIAYNYKFNDRLIATTKIYGSQFTRDWWRQNTALKKAGDVRSYVGETIFNEKYSYLGGETFGNDDWVRVGSVVNGRENTTARNRIFRVAGAQETIKYNFKAGRTFHAVETGIKVHSEQFFNQEYRNDSSRFARSGRLVKDEKFLLTATSGYLKYNFSIKNFFASPTIRFENIIMYRFDQLSLGTDPNNDGGKFYGSRKNAFSQLIPGISAGYKLIDTTQHSLTVHGSVYRGYTPPTSDFGFYVVKEDGYVTVNPKKDDILNMAPELSTNYEGGFRGYFLNNAVNGQATYFNNNIRNYYSPGRSESFQTLGSVNISGIETGLAFNLKHIIKSENHNITLGISHTYLMSSITGGILKDADLLAAKHTDATKNEIIDNINAERDGYNVYFAGSGGADSLVSRDLDISDFSKIKSLEMLFANGGISGKKVPYIPENILNLSLTYRFKKFSVGGNYNLVGAQYTDYLNLENETGEAAIGKLEAFRTIDVNMSYTFSSKKHKILDGLSVFAAGKNVTNEVYKASRLHRVSSGIMPGGFRQVNFGLKISL